MDKKKIIRIINKNQSKHRGILPEVEALIIARDLDVDITNFLVDVENRIIELKR